MATYRTSHIIDPPAKNGPFVMIEVEADSEEEAWSRGREVLAEAYPDSVEDRDSVHATVRLMGDK